MSINYMFLQQRGIREYTIDKAPNVSPSITPAASITTIHFPSLHTTLQLSPQETIISTENEQSRQLLKQVIVEVLGQSPLSNSHSF